MLVDYFLENEWALAMQGYEDEYQKRSKGILEEVNNENKYYDPNQLTKGEEGQYVFAIEEVKDFISKDGREFTKLKMVIVEGEKAGRHTTRILPFNDERSKQYLSQLTYHCGATYVDDNGNVLPKKIPPHDLKKMKFLGELSFTESKGNVYANVKPLEGILDDGVLNPQTSINEVYGEEYLQSQGAKDEAIPF